MYTVNSKKLNSHRKRLISLFAAILFLFSSIFSYAPSYAEGETSNPAHVINVFDIDVKAGATYYEQYIPEGCSGGEGAVDQLDNVYVWQADSSAAGHKFVYNVKLSVSGEGNSEQGEMTDVGFIKIYIPEHILKLRDSSDASDPDSIELPVPSINQIEYKVVDGEKVYATDRQFVYDYDEETHQYVIFNILPVSAGVVYEFPVAYIMNKNTWEYQDLGESDPFKARVEVASWEKESSHDDETERITISQDTRELPVYIDTGAVLSSTSKKAESVLIGAEDAAAKMGMASDSLDAGYRYTVWSVTSDISSVTQKYSISLGDDPAYPITGTDADGTTHTVYGEVVAVKLGGTLFTGVDGIEQAQNTGISGLTTSGKRTDYVLTRYPYSATDVAEGVETIETASKPGSYSATNDVEVVLTPNDGQDASSSAESSAVFKFDVKDPVWKPVELSYTSSKWGLYNNGSKRVGNKNNITSYNLGDLEDTCVSGLQFETASTAHAYGKTISDLNEEILALLIDTTAEDGTVIITAGTRVYTFNSNNVSVYTMNDEERSITGSYTEPLKSLDMQRIVAQDIADTYYGQQSVRYVLEDKSLVLTDVNDSENSITLGTGDYHIDSISYTYLVRRAQYDPDNMEFSAGPDNGFMDNAEQNTLYFYVYRGGSDTPQLAGTVNAATGETVINDPALVKSLSTDSIVFTDDAAVTGYKIETSNTYYYVELDTKPSVTINSTDNVKTVIDSILEDPENKEQKVSLKNTCNWSATAQDTTLLSVDKSGTDYIADIVRTSDISKKALGERTSYKGQDGKTYKSRNDTLAGQYELAWQTKVSEVADGVEVNGSIMNNVPVTQQSGIFYDLLPSYSDIIEGSVNVYVDASGDVNESTEALPSSSFEVLDRIDNYNGSGKKLLIIKINAPCTTSYTVTYVTVHSHDDIQDYGQFALNTVAYQTGNADIGEGYPDDGGNYAVSMSGYLKGLDPENGNAKRFIYAEATEDILALFPTSSGIYKKVSTQSDPTYRKSGIVHNGETYTYSIRMQNDSSTKARDIAILDSVENYRTPEGAEKSINYGLSVDRDWNGQIVSFDLTGIENKMGDEKDDLKLILYTGSKNIDLDNQNFSEVEKRKYLLNTILGDDEEAERAKAGLSAEEIAAIDEEAHDWKPVDWRNPEETLGDGGLEKVTAFIVYTGKYFTLPKGESMSFTVKMKAPDTVEVEGTADPDNGVFLSHPKTYNNVYRSFTATAEKDSEAEEQPTYFYTHYDYTQVEYSTTGTLKFAKKDSETCEKVAGVSFNLSGISDYGTPYDETLVSDGNGIVTFRNLERGTYQLIESMSDDDHILDTTPRTVKVDPQGVFTFIRIDGEPMLTVNEDGNVIINPSDDDDIEVDKNGNFSLNNDPRYHGDLTFRKVDTLDTSKGISGVTFNLTGTSMYNTVYDLTAVSGSDGTVTFENIEKGDYTLTEIMAQDGYLPPVNNVYQVECTGKKSLVFKISGENADSKGEIPVIGNVPVAEMNLQKVDSITNETLDDAVFTLKADADPDLSSVIQNAVSNLPDGKTGWTLDDYSVWTKTVSSSGSGRYIFTYLPEGSYTLIETSAPDHYAGSGNAYTIKVVKSSDGKRLVVKVPGDSEASEGSETSVWSYIRINSTGDGFEETDAENAQYQRLMNEEIYEDGKTVIKSWVGSTTAAGTFPALHLSSQKAEAELVKVTIGTEFKKLIRGNRSNFTGLVRENSLPAGKTLMVDRTGDASEETGEFYAWWDSTDNKVHWYSDADVIYFPRDCDEMFGYITNNNFTTLDLSPFNFEKVEKMQRMFNQSTSLQTVNLESMISTPKLYSCWNMFQGCTSLTEVDLSNWETTSEEIPENYALNFRSMFQGCTSLETVLMSNLSTSKMGTMRQMFCNTKLLERVVIGKDISFVDYIPQNPKVSNNEDITDTDSLRSINGMFWIYSSAPDYNTTKLIIDLSGIDTSNVINMKNAFNNIQSVQTIYVSDKWKINSNISLSTDVFSWTLYNLKGENNTACYKSNKYTAAYAKIDGGEDDPGYFSSITNSEKISVAEVAELRGISEAEAEEYLKNVDTIQENTDAGVGSDSDNNDNTDNTDTTDTTGGTFTYVPSDYSGFTKNGKSKVTETDAVDDTELNKKSFDFEYITAGKGTAVDGKTDEYTVDETLYMTVLETIKAGDKYYTCTQKYKYDDTLTATWTKVNTTAPAQWYCEMKVFNADDVLYAWEDEVDGFSSTALASNPVKTVGRENKPVITNSTGPIGSLKLTKKLSNAVGEKYSEDSFRFKVTIWTNSDKSDGSRYQVSPFEDGVAYFDVRPGAAEDDEVVIRGIPEGSVYEVQEVDENRNAGCVAGYTIVNTGFVDGNIEGNKTSEAEITNSIDTTDLLLTKAIELYKITEESDEPKLIGDEEDDEADPDYNEWNNEEFTFTVTLNNLVKGQTYTYSVGTLSEEGGTKTLVDPAVYTFTGSNTSPNTEVTVTLKGGQTAWFKDVPVGSEYRIDEAELISEESYITYSTLHEITGGNSFDKAAGYSTDDYKNGSVTTDDPSDAEGESGDSTDSDTGDDTDDESGDAATDLRLGASPDTVTFINQKTIDETQIPKFVDVTVKKDWYSEDGLPVHWMTNDEGKYVKFSYDEASDAYVEDSENGAYIPMDSNDKVLSNYPSFLKVILGRALKVGSGDNVIYTDIEAGYDSVSLNVKGDWSYTFTNLDMFGELTLNGKTEKYPYVYFVSEVVPVGFSNVNGVSGDSIDDTEQDAKTKIGTGEFFVAGGTDGHLGFTFKNREDKTCQLSVEKRVTGNFGNKNKDFSFEIEFTGSDGKPLSGTGFTMQFADDDESDGVRNRTYTLEAGSTLVQLPHGKKVTFLGLPEGTTYKITEKKAGGYKAYSGEISADVDPDEIEKSYLEQTNVCTGKLDNDKSYLYINDCTLLVPTGVGVPLIGLILLGGVAILGICRIRRRRHKAVVSDD